MHKGKHAARKAVLAALVAMMLLAGGLQIAQAEMTQLLGAEALATLTSIEKVEDDFYYVNYVADYALDELMTTGAGDMQALGAFVSEKLLHGLPFGLKTLSLACSSYAAQTPEGDYIQGRNMDFALAQNILVRTNPENGYASLSMASGELLGYIDSVPEETIGQLFVLAAPYYALDGINEKGLSIAILLQSEAEQAYQDTGKLPITTTLATRLVLDKAATVAEAIDLLAQYDMHSMLETNFHYLIVDAQGDRAVIEYVDHEMRVIRSEGYGLGVTNFFLSPDVVEAVRDGEDRLEIIQAALDAGEGIVDYETAWQILGDVKAVHDLDEKRGIDYNTAYSMIFNNTKRSMDVCINMHFDRVYTYDVIEAQ